MITLEQVKEYFESNFPTPVEHPNAWKFAYLTAYDAGRERDVFEIQLLKGDNNIAAFIDSEDDFASAASRFRGFIRG